MVKKTSICDFRLSDVVSLVAPMTDSKDRKIVGTFGHERIYRGAVTDSGLQ